MPIPVHLNTHSVPEALRVADIELALIGGMQAWSQAAGIQLFAYVGRVRLEVALADDGWNTISFVDSDWEAATSGLPVGASHAGGTCTWSQRDAVGSPPNHGVIKSDFLRAFDVAINAERFRWTIGATQNHFDVQSVITHELGHVLGLGHADADHRADDAPTMVERMSPDSTKWRTLEADDIKGVSTSSWASNGEILPRRNMDTTTATSLRLSPFA